MFIKCFKIYVEILFTCTIASEIVVGDLIPTRNGLCSMVSLSEIIGGRYSCETWSEHSQRIQTEDQEDGQAWSLNESDEPTNMLELIAVCVKKKGSFYLRLNMTKRVNEFLDLGWFRYIYLSTASVFVCFVLCVHGVCVCVCVCAQTLDVFLTWFVCLRNQSVSGLQSHLPDQQVHLDQSPPGKPNVILISLKNSMLECIMLRAARALSNMCWASLLQPCAGHDWKERKANDSKCIKKQGDHVSFMHAFSNSW